MNTKIEKMNKVQVLWNAFTKYKETAEQHEFPYLALCDSRMIPLYQDLHKNYTEEHADIFIRVMTKLLKKIGVKIQEV